MGRVPSATRTMGVAAEIGKSVVGWCLHAFAGCALAWGLVADRRAATTPVNADHERDVTTDAALAALVYELLDAHADTSRLAGGLECDPRWAAHLDYLRVLQRTGREVLAPSTVRTPRPGRLPLGDSRRESR